MARRAPLRAIRVGVIRHIVLLVGLLAVGIFGIASSVFAAPRGPLAPVRLYALKPCTPIYASADVHSTLLTQLLPGTDVAGLGQLTVGTKRWTHVSFWSGVDGYVPSDEVSSNFPVGIRDNGCSYPGLPSADSNPLASNRGPFPLAGRAVVTIPSTVYASADNHSTPLTNPPVGTAVTFTEWATDTSGTPWYHVTLPQGTGWIWGGNIRMDLPDPATRIVGGHPIWASMAGKGMYGTNYLVHHSDVNVLVQAAKRAGITHIYAEVAISRFGFYGQNSLDRLLPVAHKAGLTVIAWIYTNLDNVGDDARMTQMVANYRTPSGDRADGMLMDIEEITDSGSVYTYGQLARAMVGPDELFVASVFHPYARTGYPYAAIAASFNVIAPMNYWHNHRNRQYPDEKVERFVSVSIQTIRAAMSVGGSTPLPVEETGQTYDMFSPAFTGWNNAPTASEVTADMRTARGIGCIGVAFYEWQTTTQDEWSAINGFSW